MGGGERERNKCERNIDRLPSACPQPETWPATQSCTLIGNQTGRLSLCGIPKPLSSTGQGRMVSFRKMTYTPRVASSPLVAVRLQPSSFLPEQFCSLLASVCLQVYILSPSFTLPLQWLLWHENLAKILYRLLITNGIKLKIIWPCLPPLFLPVPSPPSHCSSPLSQIVVIFYAFICSCCLKSIPKSLTWQTHTYSVRLIPDFTSLNSCLVCTAFPCPSAVLMYCWPREGT